MRNEPEIVKILREEENLGNQDYKMYKKYKFIDKFHKEKYIKEIKEEIKNSHYYQDIRKDTLVNCTYETSESKPLYKQTNYNRDSEIDLEFETKVNKNGSVLNVKSEDYFYLDSMKKERTSIDDIDRAIIELMRVNRWLTPSDIAKLVGCSHTAIKYRIYALYKAGILYDFGIKLKRVKR